MRTIRSETFRRLARSSAISPASPMAIVVEMTLVLARFGCAVVLFLIQDTDGDPPCRNHRVETRRIILEPAFHCHEQHLALKANSPLQISGVVAQFYRVADGARLQPHPSLGRRPHNDGPFAVDQQY